MPGINIIQKQIVELDVNLPGTSPFSLHAQASVWCNETLIPAIDSKLEKYSLLEDIIRLENISIHVNDTSDPFNSSLADRIAAEVERMVAVKMTDVDSEDKAGVVQLRKEDTYIDTLIFFLENGYLPWNSKINSVADFNDLLQEMSAVTISGKQALRLKELLNWPLVQQRLLATADTALLEMLLSFVAPTTKQEIKTFTTQIHSLSFLIGSFPARKQFILNIHGFFISQTLLKPNFYNHNSLLRKAISMLQSEYEISSSEINDHFVSQSFQYSSNPLFPAEIMEWSSLQAEEKNFDPGPGENISATVSKEGTLKPNKDNQTNRAKPLLHTEENEADQAYEEDSEKQQLKQKQAHLKTEGIFINNAGLVITTPFLPRLFENTGVTENGKLNSAHLAAAMLHFIATGTTEYSEFELVLPKILCGLQPEDNIDIIASLPQTFTNEADEMLRSLISHWSVLKDTSVDGLRQSFLKRDGKLRFVNNEWLLQVEQRPYDMLLQQLSWNISILRLSWMQHVLRTEWA